MSSPPSSRDLGSRIRCLDYKPQLQCTSVSTARREPAPPAISTGNRSSAQLGYQASRQRKACLFENCLWWGNQGPERQFSKIAQGVSDGV